MISMEDIVHVAVDDIHVPFIYDVYMCIYILYTQCMCYMWSAFVYIHIIHIYIYAYRFTYMYIYDVRIYMHVHACTCCVHCIYIHVSGREHYTCMLCE